MKAQCGTEVAKMTKEKCKGITVLRHHQFFPIIHPGGMPVYFNEEYYNETKTVIEESTESELCGFHFGNNLSKNLTVKINSKLPYSLIAQTYCPRSYWSCDKFF
jgi:hypothetical protein